MKRNYYSHYQLAPADSRLPVKENALRGIDLKGILGRFALDDLILFAVILILITDEKPDMITILALVYIFIT